MNLLKKVLAYLGLAAVTVFIVAVVALLVTGGLAEHKGVIFGSLSLFLLFGGGAVVIQKLQDRAAKEDARKEDKA